jgi:hypothetical protein
MTDNLKLWEAVADIDPKFTKPITGKQYKGTSPNPQYLIKLATEHLGPVGKGFGWKVIKEEFQPLGDDVIHWCRIEFWWTEGLVSIQEGYPPEPILHTFQQYGQTKAFYKTKNGTMTDEDAPKKSLTDAIVKSLSQLGFAGNIFLGRWDDQKYVQEVNAEFRQAERATSDADQAKQITDDNVDLESAVDLDDLTARYTAIFRRWNKGHDKADVSRVPSEVVATKDAMKARLGEEERDAA